MPACEKCWAEASREPYGVADRYAELLKTRFGCTPEEQAGQDATVCDLCKRKTVHQYAKVCTFCRTVAAPPPPNTEQGSR